LLNLAVTEPKLANAAVTDAKLADGAVTSGKIGLGAVTDARLADGAVTNAKLANDAVTTLKLFNAAVTSGKLADGSVGNSKLADSAVSTSKIADSAVNGDKLASTISGSKKFSENLTCDNTVFAKKFTTTSDANLKDHVSSVETAADVIQALRPVAYQFKDSPDKQFGLIAQEVVLLLPQVVQHGENLSIDYTSIFTLLLRSHQELTARVAQLEARLNA
jgi:hypothetical protein